MQEPEHNRVFLIWQSSNEKGSFEDPHIYDVPLPILRTLHAMGMLTMGAVSWLPKAQSVSGEREIRKLVNRLMEAHNEANGLQGNTPNLSR
jgi:hypothetical protein